MKSNKKSLIIILAIVIVAACGVAAFFLMTDSMSRSAFSVSRFGAVPGDGDDDTAAIQKAINEAPDGGTVYLPKGVYDISTLHIRKPVKLLGKSKEDTILRFDGSAGIDEIIRMDGVDGAQITGLTIDGQDGKLLLYGINCTGSKHLLIHDIVLKNLGYGQFGVYFNGSPDTPGATDSEISGCVIENIGNKVDPQDDGSLLQGAGIAFRWRSSRNRALNNTITNMGRNGIVANETSTDLIIRGNKIDQTARFDGMGVELVGYCGRSVVEDNVMDRWLSISVFSDYTAVRRNTVHSDDPGRIGWCALEALGENLIFTDNICEGNEETGVSMTDSDQFNYSYFGYNSLRDYLVSSCMVSGQEDSEKSGNIYFYNDVFAAARTGDPLSDAPGNDGHGIRIENTHNITFDTCTIEGNQGAGVLFGSAGLSNISFINCKILNNEGNAFLVNPDPEEEMPRGFVPEGFEFVEGEVQGNGDDAVPTGNGFETESPVAIIDCLDEGVVGHWITFESQSTSEGGDIAHVLWDFNDGIPSSNALDSHAYGKAGTYRVTLIVWDEMGRSAMAEKTIVIKDGPAPNPNDPDAAPIIVPAPLMRSETAAADMEKEKAGGLVDNTDPNWVWDGWPEYTDSAAKGGSAHGCNGAVGSSGEYEFTGTGVEYYAWRGGDGGEVEVFLDGESQGTFSLVNPDGNDDTYDQMIFAASDLENGVHTIKIVAANDDWCMVDYLLILQ